MNQDKSVVIIYNPLAGRGNAIRYANLSRQVLESNGWIVKALIRTEYTGHAENELSPTWSTEVALIVVVAGDGTLREVCAGLDPEYGKAVVAFIPVGNANVIARELGIPIEPKNAVNLLTAGVPGAMDAGVVTLDTGERKVFLAMVEIGYGAKVVHLVDELRRRWIKMMYKVSGSVLYAIAGILALSPKANIPFSMIVDNWRVYPGIRHSVITNTETYARGWSVTPGARYDDGMLDVIFRKDCRILNTLRLLICAIQKKRLSNSFARYSRARYVDIKSEHLLFIQTDGDPIPACKEFSVGVYPGYFRILIPPGKDGIGR